MSSRAVVALLLVFALGVAAVAAVAARDERDLAFTLGVAPALVAAEIRPGGEACQRPVAVAHDISGVRMQLGTYERPGPPIEAVVRPVAGGRPLAAGRLAGGYPDVTEQTVSLDRPVAAGRRVAVCVRNAGDRRVAVYGGPELARRGSAVYVGGVEQSTDMALVFTREGRSALARVPDVFERATVFRAGWVGAWTYWVLLALVLLAAPALLGLALRDTCAGPGKC
jgi:hypothetical protein